MDAIVKLALRLLFWVAIAVFAVIFAVSNREQVAVTLWPLRTFVEAPLFVVAIAALILGVVLGRIGRHGRPAGRFGRRLRRVAPKKASKK